MTNKQKEKISVLRQAGTSYKEIAEQLDLSVNTVKSYCQRHELQTYEGQKQPAFVYAMSR